MKLSTIGVMRLVAPRISALASALFACAVALAEPAPTRGETRSGAPPLEAAAKPFWRLAFSPYTYHFSNDSEHRPVRMFGVERQRAAVSLMAAAYVRNSFAQPGAYGFAGQRIAHWLAEPLFLYWSAGVLWGYKGA